MFAPVRPPYLIRRFYNEFTWSLPGDERKVYLTFDDGPIPGITEFVLDTLEQYGAKATFFCVGNNVRSHPQIYKRIIENGHRTGNHTYSHVNGWRTPINDYLQEIALAGDHIASDLFRPPYGRIKKCQAEAILPHYRVIMWDIISYDYDPSVSATQCLLNVTTHTRPGSIIVFHDNIKSFRNLQVVLPRYLDYLKQNNYSAVVIP